MTTAQIDQHDAHAAHAHGDPEEHLAHHFDDKHQQFDSGKLGIWLFLVTEILFFSGLFCAYTIYRSLHPEVFTHCSQFLDTSFGAINTVVLLFSSLTAAWAVRNAQLGQQRALQVNILLTLACAATFMVIKYFEYSHKLELGLSPGGTFHYLGGTDPVPEGTLPVAEVAAANPDHPQVKNMHLFFSIYYGMTGLHGFHVLGGIVVWIWMLMRARRGEFGPKYFGPIDFTALYWHVVDLIWIYLFPLLYLIN
jgi:cytochrome c oxidase subunit 3